MAYFKCGSGGSSVEIDGVEYDGDLKLVSDNVYENLPDIPEVGESFVHENCIYLVSTSKMYKCDNDIWQFVANLPYTNYRSGFCSYQGCVYMIGSYTTSYNETMYKFNGESWTNVSTSSADGHRITFSTHAGAIGVLNDRIYMLGQNDGSVVYTTYQRFNQSNNTWSYLGNLPFNISSSSKCIVTTEHNGLLYITTSNSSEIYSFNGSSFTKITDSPESSGKLVINNNKLYRCCATKNDYTNYNYDYSKSKKIYFYSDGEWTEDEEAPYELYYSRCNSCKNKIYVIGGSFRYYTNNSSSSTPTYPYTKKFSCLSKTKAYYQKGEN